jgi:sec-independent protein translocase protein TatA
MLENLFKPTHLMIVFAIALLFFGGKKIPELARGIGEGLRGFRDGMKEATEESPSAGKNA